MAVLLSGRRGEHLLVSDGFRTIRLDGPPGPFSRGPEYLRYSLGGLIAAAPRLLTLRRFLMLRTWYALAGGADQREIAEALLGRSAGEPRWRSREPSLRSRAQRLVRSARVLASGIANCLVPIVRHARNSAHIAIAVRKSA